MSQTSDMGRRLLLPLFIFFCILSKPLWGQGNSIQEVLTFADLLRHYAQNPEFYPLLEKEERALLESFKKNDINTLKSLPPATLKGLIDRFNAKFVGFKETRDKIQNQIQTLKARKVATPLSDKSVIVELDLKIKASEGQFKQSRFVLFSTSIQANKALLENLQNKDVKNAMAATTAPNNLNSATPASDANKTAAPPKMPGTYQGSKTDRASATEAEKLNLTPVDPEFYGTQLGKKLEKDLGGRADYWSYDYDQDELYAVVGNSVGKLRVKSKDQATRIIQTRVGSDFNDFPSNYQGDEAIDLSKAKGRFLTGSTAEATLFGPFPSTETPALSEDPIHKHKAGDGHKHAH